MSDEDDRLPNTSPLMPERHPDHDLFLCDVSDAVLKDVMAQMEHPLFSLSKKPETTVRRYENNGNWVEVTPSVKGMATIYDKDILIYCISQIMHKLKRGERVSKKARINSHDLLAFANRGTHGRAYTRLSEAIDRLAGTRIKTNIKTGDEEQEDTFGLIESSSIRRKHGLDGRLLWCDITLSDWVFNAIEKSEVLTLHRDYFRLKKPTERRVYEIARKHCGRQPQWKIGLGLLLKKSGSLSPEKEFRRIIKGIVETDHLPDYHVSFDSGTDMVWFYNRGTMLEEDAAIEVGTLSSGAYEECRRVCPRWDPYAVEAAWREWMEFGDMDPPKNPDKAFVGFAKKFYKKRGAPK